MGRTCGEPDEIKKNTHPKYFTALFRGSVGTGFGRKGKGGGADHDEATQTNTGVLACQKLLIDSLIMTPIAEAFHQQEPQQGVIFVLRGGSGVITAACCFALDAPRTALAAALEHTHAPQVHVHAHRCSHARPPPPASSAHHCTSARAPMLACMHACCTQHAHAHATGACEHAIMVSMLTPLRRPVCNCNRRTTRGCTRVQGAS